MVNTEDLRIAVDLARMQGQTLCPVTASELAQLLEEYNKSLDDIDDLEHDAQDSQERCSKLEDRIDDAEAEIALLEEDLEAVTNRFRLLKDVLK